MRTKPRLLGNAGCEFCATFRFEEMCVQNRCDTYNRKDKVKKAKARIGVIILAYITDNHKRVYTKDTRTFQKIRSQLSISRHTTARQSLQSRQVSKPELIMR
jgi:hypothetical protein